jgi:hypothetical protein
LNQYGGTKKRNQSKSMHSLEDGTKNAENTKAATKETCYQEATRRQEQQ